LSSVADIIALKSVLNFFPYFLKPKNYSKLAFKGCSTTTLADLSLQIGFSKRVS